MTSVSILAAISLIAFITCLRCFNLYSFGYSDYIAKEFETYSSWLGYEKNRRFYIYGIILSSILLVASFIPFSWGKYIIITEGVFFALFVMAYSFILEKEFYKSKQNIKRIVFNFSDKKNTLDFENLYDCCINELSLLYYNWLPLIFLTLSHLAFGNIYK
jgi:hypothetical protein